MLKNLSETLTRKRTTPESSISLRGTLICLFCGIARSGTCHSSTGACANGNSVLISTLRRQQVGPMSSPTFQRRFLPDLFADLAEICTGRRPDWPMPADDIFIRSMESHLEWPIALTRSWLIQQTEESKSFDSRLQEWMAKARLAPSCETTRKSGSLPFTGLQAAWRIF